MELTHPLAAAVFALAALGHLCGALSPLGVFRLHRQLLAAVGLAAASIVVIAGAPVVVLVALILGSAIVLSDLRAALGVDYRTVPAVPEQRPAR